MPSANHSKHLNAFCRVVVFIFLLTSNGLAQEASNKRGFQPGNSFAIGNFETINTTNGNLMLRFPLGTLPAGPQWLNGGNQSLLQQQTLRQRDRIFSGRGPVLRDHRR